MKIRNQFISGALYGLIILSVWFLVEGFYVAATVSRAPFWAAIFNLGVAAPLALVGALIGGVAAAAWGVLQGSPDALGGAFAAAREWLWGGNTKQRIHRSAWLIATPILVACWLGAGVVAGTAVVGSVKTAEFVVLLIVGIQIVAGAAFLLLSPLVVLAIRALLALVQNAWARISAREIIVPIYGVGLMLVLAGVGVAILWRTYPQNVPLLPWSFVLGPAAGVLAAILTGYLVHTRPRRRLLCMVPGTVLVCALGVFTLYLPVSLQKAREVFVGQTTATSMWYGALERRLDHDGDGTIAYYAGNDCAPHNPAINPFATEIIGNGIDENCSGSDLVIDKDKFGPGKLNHPAPKGIVKRPNIILITTDALSARHTTVGGYRRDTTPNLVEWAKDATVFESGFSLSSSTRLSLPGLAAGQFNSMIPMKDGRIHPYSFASDTQTVASLLKKEGYRTVFIPGENYFFKDRWPGISIGFDVVDTSAYNSAKDKIHTAPDVTRRALHYLEEQDPRKPIFLWVHYFDHHGPYKTPKGHEIFKGTEPVDHYDNELHWADKHWGELMREVQTRWKPEEYVMVFSSDHGESFDPKKRQHHGEGLGTELLHIPIMIQGPTRRGATLPGLVSHADIASTLVNLAGINAPEIWTGESLIPVLFDDKPVQKGVLYSLLYIPEESKRQKSGFRNIGVRTEDFLYLEDLRTGSRELIDWKNDPLDAHDLSKIHPETFELYRYLAAQKLAWLSEHEEALSYLRKEKKKAKKEVKKDAEKARPKDELDAGNPGDAGVEKKAGTLKNLKAVPELKRVRPVRTHVGTPRLIKSRVKTREVAKPHE